MPKRKPMMVHLCNAYSVPGKSECREFIWSNGLECRKCWLLVCPRRGMKAKEARADADELWELKHKEADDA